MGRDLPWMGKGFLRTNLKNSKKTQASQNKRVLVMKLFVKKESELIDILPKSSYNVPCRICDGSTFLQ